MLQIGVQCSDQGQNGAECVRISGGGHVQCPACVLAARRQRAERPAHGSAPHRSVLCRWAALCSLAVRALGWRQQLGRQCEGGDPRCLAVKLAEVAGGRATSPGGRGLSPASDICKMPLVIYLYSL